MNRLALAFRLFWNALTNPEFAQRARPMLEAAPTGADLRVLIVLQRDGRLVDFLQEDIDHYSDDQVGAAVRDIHRGCRKVLRDYMTVEPVYQEAEETPVTVPYGFDPNAIRLMGNVTGNPPFRGVLKHKGWKVKTVKLPVLPGGASANDGSILAPAEVEIA